MDSQLFRKSFWFGRLIWMTGSIPKRAKGKLRKMVSQCYVDPTEIIWMCADHFTSLYNRGLTREFLDRYSVIVVDQFEDFAGYKAQAFLNCIRDFQELKDGHALNLVLYSHPQISEDLNRFEIFSPFEFPIDDEVNDPGEENARVHSIILLASHSTGVKVVTTTDRALEFLKQFLAEEGLEDTFLLIREGLLRSKNGNLRLSNLLPASTENEENCRAAEPICF